MYRSAFRLMVAVGAKRVLARAMSGFVFMAAAGAAHSVEQTCVPESIRSPTAHDYRVAPPDVLRRVETFHFGPGVESLTKGNSTVVFGADIAFALKYFPNHPRVLATLVRLAKREKTDRPRGVGAPVGCYFESALQIAPDDGMVELLYGVWLTETSDQKGAPEHLKRARELAPPGNANYQYNLGLGWFAVGRYEEALEAAHAAYGLGYPLPGLRMKLERAGKWRPLPPATPSEATLEKTSDKVEDKNAVPPSDGKQ